MTYPIRIIQVTDTHLFGGQDSCLLGLNTHDSFNAVVEDIQNQPEQPAFILATGDLVQENTLAAYQRFCDGLSPLGVPVYCLMGNHDNQTMFNQVVRTPFSQQKVVELDKWRIILLNSQEVDHVPGFLEYAELELLERELKLAQDQHVVICLHHQPVPIGTKWLDKLGLRNAKDFFNIIEHYSNVKAVLWGHVHQEFEMKQNDTLFLSCPSTCVQFKQGSDEFAVDASLAPGYRTLELSEDGTIKTSIKRLQGFKNTVDAAATGYK